MKLHAIDMTHGEADLILDALRDFAEGCRTSDDDGTDAAEMADQLADKLLRRFDRDHLTHAAQS